MNELITPLSLPDRFNQLVGGWKKEMWHLSNRPKIIEYPAYQDIIKMGEKALPLIFENFSQTGSHWFSALAEITDNDVAMGAKTHKQAQYMWLDWAQEEGHIAKTEEYCPKIYDIDRLQFTVIGDFVKAIGWQGRYLEFLVGEEEFVKEIINKCPKKLTRKEVFNEIWLSRDDKSGAIRFQVEIINGWVKIKDWSQLREMAFSQDDRDRLEHVLEQFKKKSSTSGKSRNHFCKRWGVIDKLQPTPNFIN